MHKYTYLINLLDIIRKENKDINSLYFYNSKENKKIENGLSRAFINFFLKSYFGVLDSNYRDSLITDGTSDGGVDAYYIDENKKYIYVIQSKFRNNFKNFTTKEIKNKDLWNMNLKRIFKDNCKKDSDGHKYNKKILELQNKISKIKDITQYKYKVLLIANIQESQKRIIENYFPKEFETEIFNYERIFNDILFPYIREGL